MISSIKAILGRFLCKAFKKPPGYTVAIPPAPGV